MTRNVSDQAKPCPMCGSKRIYVDEPEYNVLFSVHIKCADCGKEITIPAKSRKIRCEECSNEERKRIEREKKKRQREMSH